MHKYRTLIQYGRGERGYFVLIVLLTLAASALAALQPWPMKLLADLVADKSAPPDRGLFGLEASLSTVLGLVVLAGLALFLMNSLLESLIIHAWTVGGRRMAYRLASDLFARLQRRSLLYHSSHAIGDSMGRATTDSWCVYQLFDALLIGPARVALTLLLMIFLMARMDSALTLVALLLAPGMVAASFLLTKPLRLAAKIKRDIEIRIQSHLQQALTGIPVVQAFAQEQREQERFADLAGTAIRAQQRSALIGSLNGLGSGLIAACGAGAILWIGARHVLENRLSIGGLLAFLYYLNAMQTQIRTLADAPAALSNFDASVDRVMEILDAAPEIADSPNAQPLPRLSGRVQFESVTFGYAPDQPVLRGVSLDIKPGEIVAIAGASGAGKSSLVQMVPRFFDPWQGRILMDGRDLRDVSLHSLRSQVALVLQEPFLFPVSIAENIAFGKPGATREEIEAAARAARAHDFIARQPQRYETVLGERGAGLSGGERQRLAIARAFLKDAPILILDEPTSALDAETEREIFEALEKLMSGRTILLVAHRPSTIRRAHRVLVLEDGRITEKS